MLHMYTADISPIGEFFPQPVNGRTGPKKAHPVCSLVSGSKTFESRTKKNCQRNILAVLTALSDIGGVLCTFFILLLHDLCNVM